MSETALIETGLSPNRVNEIVSSWVQEFAAAVAAGDGTQVPALFCTDSWWRDLLALTWDFRTFRGLQAIEKLFGDEGKSSGLETLVLRSGGLPEIVHGEGGKVWIQAFLEFESEVSRGLAVVRLVPEEDGTWRAWTLLTAMDVLKGFEPALGQKRPVGKESALSTQTWLERRSDEAEFDDDDPAVVIVGAGQGGLSLAANLGLLGVRTLVLEKNNRVGDNWRERYRSLVLHDPVWADHLPHLPFPESWPIYTPKDKLGDWFETYASAMELNVWTNAQLESADFDEISGTWEVSVRQGEGTVRVLRPHHVVMATGVLGEGNAPTFPGVERFKGKVYHSSEHKEATGWDGRRAVIVGASVSGHDIARDFHENGAEVTLIQRSSTYVMSQAKGMPVIFGDLYKQGGPPTGDADLLQSAFPMGLVLEFAKENTKTIAELDRPLLEGLTKAGFSLGWGDNGGGMMELAYTRGGGYYIDVGTSGLIVDGSIKVKSGYGVSSFTETGVVLEDGTELEADVVVLATGFSNMRDRARTLFGDRVADRCTEVWGLDDEGEIRGLWRQSGHPNFWFMGGPLLGARIYSKYLALQIQATEIGLLNSHRGGSDV